jgi:hypothetical protein
VNPAVQGYAAAALDAPPAEVAAVADELAALDRAVTDNPALRSALTDSAVPGPARRAVLEDVLTGKVSARAQRAAGFAVAAVPAPDVPAALSWLAYRAYQAADQAQPITG